MTRLWFFIFAACSSPVLAQVADTLKVENGSNGSAEVWLWPKSTSTWERPELFVPAKGVGYLHYRDGETYWLLARDRYLREVPVGWVNISQKLIDNPKTTLKLNEVFESRVQSGAMWNPCRRRWETRERTYTVSRLIVDFATPDQEKAQPK